MKRQISRVAGFNYIEHDDWFYVGCTENNFISRINKKTGKVELLGSDKLSNSCGEMVWAKSAIVDSKIVFAPFAGRSMYIYDTIDNILKEIEIDYSEFESLNATKVWQTVGYGDSFYLMGFGFSGIIKINAYTDKVKYIGFSGDDFSGLKYCIADGCVICNDKMYLSIGVSNRILKYDLKNDKYELISIDAEIGNLSYISANGDELWLCTENYEDSRIIIFNIKTNTTRVLDVHEKGEWYAPVFYDGFAYLFPCSAKSRALKVNTDSYEVSVFEEVDQKLLDEKKHVRGYSLYMAQLDGNSITFIRRPDCVWFTYDFESGKMTERSYEIEDAEYVSKVKREYQEDLFNRAAKGNIIVEEDDMPLQDFINKLAQ